MFHTVKSIPLIATAVIASTVAAHPVRAQGANAILARAAAKYQSAKTLRIQFTQTLTNSLIGTTSTATGELLRKHPNLFSINFTSSSDRIVCDGTSIWLYLPSSAPDQVIKLPMNSMGTMFVDPLGQILTSPGDQYAVANAGSNKINGHATHAIVLTPKHKDAALFTKATIWIDDTDSTVRQIETVESSGVQRHILITKVTIGRSIPQTAFSFTPPKNVRVIDQRAMLGGQR